MSHKLGEAQKPRIYNTAKYHPETSYLLSLISDIAYKEDNDETRQEVAELDYEYCGMVKSLDESDYDAQAVVLKKVVSGNEKGHSILAFRGTEGNIEDISTDAKFFKEKSAWGRVHTGFNESLDDIWPKLREEYLDVLDTPLWITGHSLGAAMANLAAERICTQKIAKGEKSIAGIYNYGCPRTGNEAFRDNFNSLLKNRCFRVVNNNDIVTNIPPELFDYDHVGTFLYLTEGGKLINDPSLWTLIKENFQGRLSDIGERGLDALKDHKLGAYQDYLKTKPPML